MIITATLGAWATVVTEDGSIAYSGNDDNKITYAPDGIITGVTESANQIISKYDLNSSIEIELRQREKFLRSKEPSTPSRQKSNSPIHFFCVALAQLATLNRNSDLLIRSTENLLRTMIYSSAITTFETFFSDYVIKAAQENPAVLRNLGESYVEFRNAKYTLKELLTSGIDPQKLAISKLQDLSFHNLNTVHAVYTAAFGINIPPFGTLSQAIENRHDIVHRNGYRIGEDKPIYLDKRDVFNLILDIQRFVIGVLAEIERSPTI